MILLLDGNNIASRAKFANAQLSANGKPTGVGFGFFKSLGKLLKDNPETSEVIICWDQGKSHYRKEKYPEYKRNRDASKEEDSYQDYVDQLTALQKVLKNLPVQQVVLPNVEADDTIAFLSNYLVSPIRIVSNDTDLFQLVAPGVSILYRKHGANKDTELTLDNFEKITSLPLAKYIFAKAIAGDSSDNILGIAGVAKVRSQKIALEVDNAGELYKLREHKTLGKYMTDENIELVKRNLDLMVLTSGHVLTREEKDKITEDVDQVTPDLRKLAIQGYFLKNKYVSLLENFGTFMQPFYDLQNKK